MSKCHLTPITQAKIRILPWNTVHFRAVTPHWLTPGPRGISNLLFLIVHRDGYILRLTDSLSLGPGFPLELPHQRLSECLLSNEDATRQV